MEKIFKKGLFVLVIFVVLASCKKEGTLNANLDLIDKNITAPTAIDTWLDNNYLTPYNIQVKYKYDRFELELGKDITPPLEGNVIPAMDMVKEGWIKTYETAGGPTFIKRISPKQFILAGSANYEVDGNMKAGTAEAGRKIVLYIINYFDKNNEGSVRGMLQVIHHEYTHILNQTVDFQADFKLISAGGYLSAYNQEDLATARSLGFITQYSRKSPQEDYAEMTSNMLLMGRVGFNAAVNATTTDGAAKLKKKEQYIVDYFKTSFNIDFYALQTAVQSKLNSLFPFMLSKMIGPGIGYTTLYAQPSTDVSQSTEFKKLWGDAKTAVAAQGYILRDLKLSFKANNSMLLEYSCGAPGSSTIYYADSDYTTSIDANGITTFALNKTQGTSTTYNNMNFFGKSLAPLTAYLNTNKFKADWINSIIPGPIGTVGSLGAFYKVGDATSYFYGVMGQ